MWKQGTYLPYFTYRKPATRKKSESVYFLIINTLWYYFSQYFFEILKIQRQTCIKILFKVVLWLAFLDSENRVGSIQSVRVCLNQQPVPNLWWRMRCRIALTAVQAFLGWKLRKLPFHDPIHLCQYMRVHVVCTIILAWLRPISFALQVINECPPLTFLDIYHGDS